MNRNNEVTLEQTLDVKFKTASRRSLIIMPLYVLVPVLFAVAFHLAGYELEWKAFGLGALGWMIALVLRAPVGLLIQRMPQPKAKKIMIASSGVMEESVRLILLALTSVASSWALSIGQGWAAIEVIYTMVSVIAIASLANRTDEKAMEAKAFLEAQGSIQTSPLWGILERIWASAFHIGCTLIVASNPWTVVLLIPLHSGVNALVVKLAAKSIPKSSLAIAVFGLGSLAIGITLML